MGSVAASGGYYISAPASKIVALPATITGSIGVIFGKINAREAMIDQGVSLDEIRLGKNSNALSVFTGFNEEQNQLVNKLIDEVYDDFIQKVALGRNMTVEKVRELAKGRIWTGEDALNNGLVDELGGLQHAILLAKKLADLPLEVNKTVTVPYPPPSPLQELLQSIGGSNVEAATLLRWLPKGLIQREVGTAVQLVDILSQGPATYSVEADILSNQSSGVQF
eukprot:TRINITY_DN24716_c0_g1_i5.p3 TRINITY_DN24716_c0_g1~~TRINITY_DN24716_c0_g1_i5.p3  ORF type:complete len:223 (-),score=49.98 TRINITY_DN24716_c0_g1_i5:255-923(-)